jgi:hypothetical protein
MSISEIKQHVANLEQAMDDNPLAMWGLILASLLVLLVFGGLIFHALLDRKREREKIKAVERLHKHLQSLPSSKS